MDVKGIILAGGKGTRLQPATLAMNKHMIPILNRPMIEYPLETLTKVFGMKEICIVSGGDHIGSFADFLGDGSRYGTNITYKVQKDPGGIAHALALTEDFMGSDRSIVILGDNIFDNKELEHDVDGFFPEDKACVFFKEVGMVEAARFGVPRFESPTMVALSEIVEKPKLPPTPYAVTGLYSFPPDVFAKIKALTPSERGELEISDLNNLYINDNRMMHRFISAFWSDAGTPESLARTTEWAAKQ